MKLDGFGIFVKDMGMMIRFYRDMLGFEIKEDKNCSNVFLEKDGTLFLFYGRRDSESMTGKQFQYADQVNGHFETALSIDDYKTVDETFKTVVAGDAVPIMAPTAKPWRQRTCCVTDPEENLVEIGSSVKGDQGTMEEFKRITMDNLDKEYICCRISDKKGENCVASKRERLRDGLQEGLVFNKLDMRRKVLIEYIPAKYAWASIETKGYMCIDCLWASSQYKGKGYEDSLMEQCIQDNKDKGKLELVCISSRKKMPFLSDPGLMGRKGSKLADTSSPYSELPYLPFDSEAGVPRVKACAKDGRIDEMGWVLYYSNQCPHTEKYASLLTDIIKGQGVECRLRKIDSREATQSAPVLFTTYTLFYNGKFVINEVSSEKSFAKLWERVRER